MSFFSNMVAILAFATIISISQTNAECCRSEFRAYHVCLGLAHEQPFKIAKPTGTYLDFFWVRENKEDESAKKCLSLFCADGSDAEDKYCGVGTCDLFGCKCIGGCRKGNRTDYETLLKTWLEEHNLVREARHKFDKRVVQFE